MGCGGGDVLHVMKCPDGCVLWECQDEWSDCELTRDAQSSFLWDSDSSPFKSPDSDSGLKSDTDSWTCVMVTVYWVNDADRQILQKI